MICRIVIGIINFVLLCGHVSAEDKKSWIYEMKSVTARSSNSDLVNIKLEVERVSRGVYALSGEVKFDVDIAEGDDNELEVTSFRKAQGDEEYKTLPLQMSRRQFYDALNTCYKDVVMSTFTDCSDLPYFEDKATVPFEKKTYVLNKCQFSQDGLPNHLESGEYKILLIGYGTVEWELEIVVEIGPSNE